MARDILPDQDAGCTHQGVVSCAQWLIPFANRIPPGTCTSRRAPNGVRLPSTVRSIPTRESDSPATPVPAAHWHRGGEMTPAEPVADHGPLTLSLSVNEPTVETA